MLDNQKKKRKKKLSEPQKLWIISTEYPKQILPGIQHMKTWWYFSGTKITFLVNDLLNFFFVQRKEKKKNRFVWRKKIFAEVKRCNDHVSNIESFYEIPHMLYSSYYIFFRSFLLIYLAPREEKKVGYDIDIYFT